MLFPVVCLLAQESAYHPNFHYQSPVPSSPFHANGTVYFSQAQPLLATTLAPSQGPPQAHYHPYHPTRTFENSNRQQQQQQHHHHLAQFQASPLFQLSSPPPSSSSSSSHFQLTSEDVCIDLPPRFRPFKAQDNEKRLTYSRPMSGDFDRSHANHYSSSNPVTRFNKDRHSQSRPQSFYEFSSQSNQGFSRSTVHNRYQRHNNGTTTNLPLSAYLNTDDVSDSNDHFYAVHGNNGNRQPQHHHNGCTSYARRRLVNPQRTHHQEKHQFPLSSYDPRHYGLSNTQTKRDEVNHRSNLGNADHNDSNDADDIDPIEEWWEDNNVELVDNDRSTRQNDSQTTMTTVNDSGNSSLSTSINCKESILDDDDDDENNPLGNELMSPPSNNSTSDSNSIVFVAEKMRVATFDVHLGHIIESLDKLQQELKFEEAVERQLAANTADTDPVPTHNEVSASSRVLQSTIVCQQSHCHLSADDVRYSSFYAMGQRKISRGISRSIDGSGMNIDEHDIQNY
jgi:hypothetical protein